MTKGGTLMLWPIRMPSNKDRRRDRWISSAHEAAVMAMERRVRIKADMGAGCYALFTSKNSLAGTEPVWPTEDFFDLLRIAFVKDGLFIGDLNHPVLKSLHDGA
jgi:hypothetical protein